MYKTKTGEEYKVVVVTPAGRSRHLEILKCYIYKAMNDGIIDGWQLWQNTNNQSDKEYMAHMAQENPKVAVFQLEGLRDYDAFRICEFFKFAQDDGTIYLRFDDDIIWLDKDMILNLLKFRTDNPNPVAVCANIVDNTLCSFIHQSKGVIDRSKGDTTFYRLDPVGWQSGEFAEHLHRTFIAKHKEGKTDDFKFDNVTLELYDPFSISCFAFFGRDHFKPDRDEEMWISSIRPKELGRPNMICGDALVVHYGYHTQRDYLDKRPDIYEFYNSLK